MNMHPVVALAALAGVGFVGYQVFKKPARFLGDKLKVGDMAVVPVGAFAPGALPTAITAQASPGGAIAISVQQTAPDSFQGMITGVVLSTTPAPGATLGSLQVQQLPVAAGPVQVARLNVLAILRGNTLLVA